MFLVLRSSFFVLNKRETLNQAVGNYFMREATLLQIWQPSTKHQEPGTFSACLLIL